MRVSQLIKDLERFVGFFGDCEVEFRKIFLDASDDPEELDLYQIHDGYNLTPEGGTQTVCEIRLTDEGA